MPVLDDPRLKTREAQRKRSIAYQEALTKQRNEIGKIPKIKNRGARRKAMNSLLYFLETFFADPPFFSDPFGEVQLDSIAHEEQVLKTGSGNINKLEPRGYGKSTRSILAAVWAVLTGKQNFVMVCSDSTEKSSDLLKMAGMALAENDLVLEAFPEVYPFHLVDGNPNKCRYQTYKDKRTKIAITNDTIVFPDLGGKYPSDQAMIVARPFKKARGKNVKGRRPSVVILDDVQSSEEANSPTSIRKNLLTLNRDIAYLGSRKNPCAIINNATVIEQDDYPSKVAELEAFTTVRYKMVKSFPVASSLWSEYQELRQSYDREIVGDRQRAAQAALEFYQANRQAMDEGSEVTWDFAFSPAKYECSTIQAAQNYIADFGEEAFLSECQNQAADHQQNSLLLPAADICNKQHPYARGVVPPDARKLVAYIDVQMEMLIFEVWAMADNFTGFKILGGEYPDQGKIFWEKQRIKRKLSDKYQGSEEDVIKQAILEAWAMLSALEFKRAGDGVAMQIDLIGTDTGFHGETLKSAYLDFPDKNRIMLCRGFGFTAKRQPLRMKKLKRLETRGMGWLLPPAKNGIEIMQVDTNMCKTFFHRRLNTPLNVVGSFSLYQAPKREHELAANHYRAEYPTILEGPYGEVTEWDVMPGKPDNDFFDCAAGCVALASKLGCTMAGVQEREGSRRRKADPKKWGSPVRR